MTSTMRNALRRIIWIQLLWPLLLVNNAIGQNCQKPFAQTPQEVSTTSAQLQWSSALDSFDIEFKQKGDTAQYVIAYGDSYLWTGLKPATKYQYRVRAICENDVSPWSNVRHFSTHINNPSDCLINLPINYYTSSCLTTNRYYIDVDEVDGQSLGVDVRLKEVKLLIKHDYLHDLTIWLHAPTGERILLLKNLGYEYDNFGNPYDTSCVQTTVLVDDLCVPMASEFIATANGTTNYVGRYRPIEPLYLLNNLGTNPNGTWWLEICDQHAPNVGTLEQVELVFDPMDCAVPASVAVSNTGGDFVEVNWTQSMTSDSLYIEYADFDFTPGQNNEPGQGNLMAISGMLSQAVLTDLQSSTQYYAYMRSRCGDDFSDNICFSFNTTCANATIISNFDDHTTCAPICNATCPIDGIWHNLSEDENEWIIRTGKTPSFSTGPKNDVSLTGNYIYTETSQCPAGITGGLQSNCLFIGEDIAEQCAFSFQRHMKGSKMGILRLLVYDLAENTWDTIWTQSGNQGKQWEQYYVDLIDYKGKTVQLRFEGVSGGSSSDMALDELILYGNIQDLGPATVFFRDEDGDGFGHPTISTTSCGNNPPNGFVSNNMDCDDSNLTVNPMVDEILCNQVDENCNGLVDDRILPKPILPTSMTVCANSALEFTISTPAVGQYFWFVDGVEVSSGQSVTLEDMVDGALIAVIDSVTDEGYTCKSDWSFTEVNVASNPYLGADTSIVFCGGSAFSGASIVLEDNGGASISTTIYSQLPFVDSNIIVGDVFVPSDFGSVFYVGTTAEGCSDTKVVSFNLAQPPAVMISPFVDTLELCPNNIEVVEAIVEQGIPPFSYQWSNGFTTNISLAQTLAEPNAVSSLSVGLMDGTGCVGYDTLQIRNHSIVTGVDIVDLQDVTMCGGANGGFTIFPQGGTPPYSISWEGPVSGEGVATESLVIQGLIQGAYIINITDSSLGACMVSFAGIIINAPGLNVELNAVDPVSCFGENDGSISFQIMGNNPTFLWSDGETAQNRNDLSPGIYNVTISDANCALSFDGIEIEEPDSLQLFLSEKLDVSCFGKADGSAQLNVFGGVAPFNYHWTAPVSIEGAVVDSLVPGVYVCRVTDGNGCTSGQVIYDIEEPDPLGLSAIVNPESCPNLADGTIQTTVVGGVTPYNYSWSDTLLSGSNVDNLAVGFYNCVIADANGCTIDGDFFIFGSETIQLDSIVSVEASCVGRSDGQLVAFASGGVGDLQYYWGSNSNNNTLANVPKGLYELKIIDDNGCAIDTIINLDAPQNLQISIDSIHGVSCAGMSDGYIGISTQGGTLPYQYQWQYGQSSSTIVALNPGIYSVTIFDGMGCVNVADSLMIDEPDTLVVESYPNPVQCSGESSGGIFVQVKGGTMPYQYLWNTNDTIRDLLAVPVGEYEMVLTDAYGCQKTIQETVLEPDTLQVELLEVAMVANCGGISSKGSINVQVSGGVTPYLYAWNSGESTQNINQLDPGDYKLVVTDDNGCNSFLKEVKVYQSELEMTATAKRIDDISCYGVGDGLIIAETKGGTAPYNYNWSNGMSIFNQWLNTPFDTIAQLGKGLYVLTITDAKGCTRVSDSFEIEEPELLHVNLDSVQHNRCEHGFISQIFTTTSGGVVPYHYLWNNLSFEEDLDSIGAGLYSVIVVDENDCSSSLPTPIVLADDMGSVSIQIDSIIPQNCQVFGAIHVSIIGDWVNPQFLWSNGSEEEDASGLLQGIYTLQVSDTTGCSLMLDDIEVPLVESDMDIKLIDLNNVSCYGQSDGSITIDILEGQAPYQYFWSNGSSNIETLDSIGTGAYSVTVSDANDCIAVSGSYNIGEPSEMQLENILITDAINEENGQIELLISGGVTPYSYAWSNGQGGNPLMGLPPNFYDVVVTDYNGCEVFVSDLYVDNITNVDQPKVKPLLIYPNPAAFTIFIRQSIVEIQSIELISAIGQVYQPIISATNNAIEMDISQLPPAIYTLKLTQKDGMIRVGMLRVIRW